MQKKLKSYHLRNNKFHDVVDKLFAHHNGDELNDNLHHAASWVTLNKYHDMLDRKQQTFILAMKLYELFKYIHREYI